MDNIGVDIIVLVSLGLIFWYNFFRKKERKENPDIEDLTREW